MFKFIEKLTYRFLGCFYTRFQKTLFRFVKEKIPKDFLNREISDLGCGDGSNTFRIKEMFQAKKIIGYEYNEDLIKKASKKGIKARKADLNKEIPRGEMAIFNLSLHHLGNKEDVLRKVIHNFQYVVLLEPVKDYYHRLFDAGQPLKEEEWLDMFNRVMNDYVVYRFRGFLLVFYKKP